MVSLKKRLLYVASEVTFMAQALINKYKNSFFYSLTSYLPYLFIFAIHKTKESHSTEHKWNKRPTILPFQSSLSLSHSLLLPQAICCTDGFALLSFIFFFSSLAGIGKACKYPKKRREFFPSAHFHKKHDK